jgi:hypothetical protein
MFILYALPIGLLAGFLTGGRFTGLAALTFRWPAAIAIGLLVQVVLFSDQVTVWIGSAGPPIYVASTAAVFMAVLANRAIPGMPIVALGAMSNFAAIAANGGYMPANPDALRALNRAESTVYSNSTVVADPALAPLTDLFALPAWVPFANVYSIGDVLIGIGIAVIIAVAMRRPPPAAAEVAAGA